MRFDNHWLNQSEQEVTVHLKKRVFKVTDEREVKTSRDVITGKTDNLGYYEHLYDLEDGKPRTMTVLVKRHGLSLREKLQVVMAAALKEFNVDVNHYMESHYDCIYEKPTMDEPDIIIDEKFMKWIRGETATAHLDKNHVIQYVEAK